jgi:hypothetical protein
MNQTAKILLFAGMVFLFETINNELFSGGFGEDPPETGCVNFLVISGESNINKFSFSYVTPRMPEGDKANKGAEDERIDFDIPVHRFKASNPRMYDDFLSLLQAEEYPYLRISLLIGETDRERKSEFTRSERISVTIAGVTREYTVNCLVSQCAEGLVLKGVQTVRLTDFGLSPPVRLKGIVKVDNEIDVRFGFIVNFTD